MMRDKLLCSKFFKNVMFKSPIKFSFVLTVILSILLVSGCFIALIKENIFSFIFSITLPVLAILNMVILVYWLIKKNKNFLYSLLSLIVFIISFSSFIQLNFIDKNNSNKTLSILTYNVRGHILKDDGDLYGNDRDNGLLTFVKEQGADIVVFQEFWNHGFENYDEYPYSFFGYRKGMLKAFQFVLSKYPIINQGYIDFPNTGNNAMFVDVDYDGEVIRIYNLHLQSFGVNINSELVESKKVATIFSKITKAQKMRKMQVQMIQRHEAKFDGKTIICGDFNSTQFSSTYKILKDPKKDTFIEAGCGLGTTYSLKGYPLRLDFIFANNGFNVIAHKNFDINLSDHEPVLARLILN